MLAHRPRAAARRLAAVLATGLLATAAAAPALAQKAVTLFTLTDPRGDDNGAGSLAYPLRPDMQRGDLDLLSVSAEMVGGGTWFTATFAQPIRNPADAVGTTGPEPLDRQARLGFYTFNLDLYIDTDRRPGSGNTAVVPGRGVTVDRRDAWEKAVILTPRPDIARVVMVKNAQRILEEQRRAQTGVVTGQDLSTIENTVEKTVDQRYFFPTQVQVRNREIRFFVPDQFLGGKANPAWAYTGIVTGAAVEQTQSALDLPFKTDAFSVFMLPVVQGRSELGFGTGGRSDPNQPPVVDVLNADATLQKRMLEDYDAVSGRLARLVGTVPTGRNQSGWEPWQGPAAVAGAGTAAGAPQQPRALALSEREAAAALSGTPLLPAPAADLAAPAPSGPSPVQGLVSPPGERKTVAQRLRELSELRQQNVITEEEYQDARRRILSGV